MGAVDTIVPPLKALRQEELDRYNTDGYLLVKSLISPQEAARYIDHYMNIAERPPIAGVDGVSDEEELVYPRLMNPHESDPLSYSLFMNPKTIDILHDILGEEPVGCQTMMFYKPPGAKGQALHQDNYYFKIKPGTCVAAWIALDPCDDQNGGLRVVPGTQDLEIKCPHKPDGTEFFNNTEVSLPEGSEPVFVEMEAGDALFFGGSLVHGSLRNRTTDRWRRSMICHYSGLSQTEQIGALYQPLLSIRGEKIYTREAPGDEGPCGGPEGNSPN